MMSKHVRTFFFFPDVFIVTLLFLAGLIFTLYHVSLLAFVYILAGAFSYALSEYVVHRFVFHMKPPKQQFFLRLLKRLHYDHHTHPNELHLLFLPWWFSLPGLFIICAIIYGFTSNIVLTLAFATGLLGYFLFYEWSHFVAHRPIQPKTAFGQKLKKHHLLHHFKNENYWYGVTHTSLDKTMGTWKEQNEVDKSQTAKRLEHR
ncbi:sterol desaturase family protein [Alkalihalobacillus pseudalcaliphilus]|uniref:sterol desaturase family protein n=1 Tax=Alkalihalobacillus pseudalcaliphilus TaxID=79884 RepID=UPI00064E0EED|nr:sterol desaturase family protein [Alkalihalobacillus pseudalcaliphilus]KMK78016.1 fatty acid hydroxylase [Alkalihalobacillus pseudalcaliphilus]